jgi:predicted MFS family arabinose efflux permease
VRRPRSGAAPWPVLNLLLLSAAVFTSVTTELLPTGVLPAMSRDLGVSEGRLGLLVTAYAVMVAVFAAPLAMATARVPRRRLLAATLVGYGLVNAVTAVSATYAFTVGGRLLGGICHGLFWGMFGGYAGRMVSADRVGRAVTFTFMGGVGAILVGVPAGTALGGAIGWRPVFWILAAVAVALAVVGWRVLPDLPGSGTLAPVRMRKVWRQPGLAGVVVATAITMTGVFTFNTYVVPFLTHAGVSEPAIGPALSAYGAGGVVGLVLATAFADRALRAAMIGSNALLVAAFGLLAVTEAPTAVAIAMVAAVGVVMGCLPNLLQAAVLRAAPAAADPASALNAVAFNVGISGGALAGGLVLDSWGPSVLPVLAVTLAAGGLLAMLADRQVGVAQPVPDTP